MSNFYPPGSFPRVLFAQSPKWEEKQGDMEMARLVHPYNANGTGALLRCNTRRRVAQPITREFMRIHTIRLLVLFGLVLFAAYASHEAGVKAQAIWKANQTSDTQLVADDDTRASQQLY